MDHCPTAQPGGRYMRHAVELREFYGTGGHVGSSDLSQIDQRDQRSLDVPHLHCARVHSVDGDVPHAEGFERGQKLVCMDSETCRLGVPTTPSDLEGRIQHWKRLDV